MKLALLLAMTVILDGCNAAVVITLGARKTTSQRPIIASEQPCPVATEGDDTRIAIVIVNPKRKHDPR